MLKFINKREETFITKSFRNFKSSYFSRYVFFHKLLFYYRYGKFGITDGKVLKKIQIDIKRNIAPSQVSNILIFVENCMKFEDIHEFSV